MRKVALLFCAISLMGGSALAKDSDKSDSKSSQQSSPQLSKEQREKMADLHDKMASCLRSDQSLDECRKQMRSSCQAMAKSGGPGCPMMGGMGMHGMHQGMSGKAGSCSGCPCGGG